MLSYPLADFLIRIKNGYMAGNDEVLCPYSKIKEGAAVVLQKYNFIKSFEVSEKDKKKTIKVNLLYQDKRKQKPAIESIKIISKPGLRVYRSCKRQKAVLSGFGLAIISTSKGLMSNLDAHRQGLGGEILAEVW
ncbi:MAG: 30S ribosomal protein S8 [candidate division CPR1 bacterium GW2011_GWA2_42_17]|uniref:Small ribosomal subunit protein uS8 n=1 Tax=candidate division CPR1 bacterium GW2011_GWA2_42_17 TaxID=1618341 RepID=A0A0G0Z5A6_9BACT|nr:MAG: 30S ribosomal protein S8 [candidate division CPR1 bacterium GW2011_GWA2_42_17]